MNRFRKSRNIMSPSDMKKYQKQRAKVNTIREAFFMRLLTKIGLVALAIAIIYFGGQKLYAQFLVYSKTVDWPAVEAEAKHIGFIWLFVTAFDGVIYTGAMSLVTHIKAHAKNRKK